MGSENSWHGPIEEYILRLCVEASTANERGHYPYASARDTDDFKRGEVDDDVGITLLAKPIEHELE